MSAARPWRPPSTGWRAAPASCSAVQSRNTTTPRTGPQTTCNLLVARASMTGFVIFDYVNRYPEGVTQLAEWLTAGKLHSHEQIEHGDVGAFPAALLKLFNGENTGKLILALQG